MATLIHCTCKTPILLDISDYFKFLVNFGIGEDCLRISLGDLIYKNKRRTVKTVFFCPECNSEVKESELESVCSFCGEYMNPSTIYKVKDKFGSIIAGEYCKNCISELENTVKIESTTELAVIISKVNIKFGG
jgi:transcription elongation factor Elf1